MNVNEYGQVTFDVDEALQHIYSGINFDNHIEDTVEISKHQQFATHFDLPPLSIAEIPDDDPMTYHHTLSNQWKMPVQYQQIDVEEFLSKKLGVLGLTSDRYVQTLAQELEEYQNRNMFDLLKFLIYLIDVCKQNNIVTGVGRGSSVASLVLYLIGVHHIDPIKYNLNYKEFLR